jgi:hypothetical protein
LTEKFKCHPQGRSGKDKSDHWQQAGPKDEQAQGKKEKNKANQKIKHSFPKAMGDRCHACTSFTKGESLSR